MYREQARAEQAVVDAVSQTDAVVLEQLARSRPTATATARAVIRRSAIDAAMRR